MMKKGQRIRAWLLVCIMALNMCAFSVATAATGDVSLSVEQALPGYKVAVAGAEDTDTITWEVSADDTEYAAIDGATGNNWAITNACAEKYIRADVNGTKTAGILVGEALPARLTGDYNYKEIVGLAAATNYAFTFNGKTYQMLDHYENAVKNEDSFYILWNGTHIGTKNFYQDPNTTDNTLDDKVKTFDPTNEYNVGYYLNNTWTGLDAAMKSDLVTTHTWLTEAPTQGGNDYTFDAGVALLSLNEVLDKYTARIGTDDTIDKYMMLRTGTVNAERIWVVQTPLTNVGSTAEPKYNDYYSTYWMSGGRENGRLRPSFYLDKTFFIDNKITEIGADVAAMLVENISYEEMFYGGQYTDAELEAMGYDVQPTVISEWGHPEKALRAGFDVDFLMQSRLKCYTTLLRHERGMSDRETWIGHSYFRKEGLGDFSLFSDEYFDQLAKTKEYGYMCLPSGSHDLKRVSVGRDADDLKVFHAFIMTMPGIPLIYYGDEIGMRYIDGMRSVEGAYKRTGSRTPMQWSSGKNYGFSDADKTYIACDPSDDAPTVEKQEKDENSLFNHMKMLVNLRKAHPALGEDSDIKLIKAGYPAIYERSCEEETIRVIINPSDREYPIEDDVKEVLAKKSVNDDNTYIGSRGYLVYKA